MYIYLFLIFKDSWKDKNNNFPCFGHHTPQT